MINLARKLAKKAKHTFAFHAAILQRGGAILSTGYNKDWIHAERMALMKLWPNKRKGCKLWSIRVTKGGKLANAKPCAKCEALLRYYGISTIWYSDSDGQVKRLNLN